MPALPAFKLFGWETYSWPKPIQQYRPALFSAFSITSPTAQNALASCTLTLAGQWGVLIGTRSGSYGIAPKLRSVLAATPDAHMLSGLQPNTTYYVVPVAFVLDPNPNGLPISNLWVGDETTFNTTSSASLPAPVLSAIVAHPATPDASHATINWTTDLPSDSTVHYALNQPPSTLNVHDATLVTAHSIVLASLASGGTYQYTVDSATAGGQRTVSAIQSFDQP